MGASKDAMDEEGNAAADLGLVARIRESFDSLTATEREAAQFILGHLTDVLVCNSVELSQLSGISQPTLSRLYRKLGYANAGEFRRASRPSSWLSGAFTAHPVRRFGRRPSAP